MDYADVIQDFAERTRTNLRFVQDAAKNSALAGSAPVYEVTQLIKTTR